MAVLEGSIPISVDVSSGVAPISVCVGNVVLVNIGKSVVVDAPTCPNEYHHRQHQAYKDQWNSFIPHDQINLPQSARKLPYARED